MSGVAEALHQYRPSSFCKTDARAFYQSVLIQVTPCFCAEGDQYVEVIFPEAEISCATQHILQECHLDAATNLKEEALSKLVEVMSKIEQCFVTTARLPLRIGYKRLCGATHYALAAEKPPWRSEPFGVACVGVALEVCGAERRKIDMWIWQQTKIRSQVSPQFRFKN